MPQEAPKAIRKRANICQSQDSSSTASPFMGVLRSKGFCWLASTRWTGPGANAWRHNTAMYWSHAGKHFGISAAGKCWGPSPKNK